MPKPKAHILQGVVDRCNPGPQRALCDSATQPSPTLAGESHSVTFCDPMDCSLGASVHGIVQAKIIRVGCHFLLEDLLKKAVELKSPMSPALGDIEYF